MLNYVIADVFRIFRKPTFIYANLCMIGVFLSLLIIKYNSQFDEEAYLELIITNAPFYRLIIGIPVFLSVYYDEFKSKALQTAIGFGISRPKVILSKFITIILTSIGSALFLGLIVWTLLPFLNLSLISAQHLQLLLNIFEEVLIVIGYISLSAILVYYSQNATIGLILYILLNSNLTKMVAVRILNQAFIQDAVGDLVPYLYTNSLRSEIEGLLQNGHLHLPMILLILSYIILPVCLSMAIFRKKELEF